jgi:MFS family permease
MLATACFGAALNPVNSSLIATALVPIAASLRVAVGRTAVLVAAVYVASAVAQPTVGRLAAAVGARRVFVAGAILVAVGGALGGTGTNIPTLVLARVVIGAGTAAGYPAAMLLIRQHSERASVGAALGLVSIASQASIAVGLPLGGLLVAVGGWRWTFFVDVPLGASAAVTGLAWLPSDIISRRVRGLRALSRELDLLGMMLFAGSLIPLMLFLLNLRNPQWFMLVAAVVLLTALLAWELRHVAPFFDVRALGANRPLRRTYVRNTLTVLQIYIVLFGVTQWLEDGRGLSALRAGLVTLPLAALGAVVSRPVSRRDLIRLPLVAGAVAALAVAAALRFSGVGTAIPVIVVITAVLGLTVGLTAVGNQAALYQQADPGEVATAAGLLRTFGYLSAIGASTVLAVVYRSGVGDAGLHELAEMLIVLSTVVLALSVFDRTVPRVLSAGGSVAVSPP